MGLNRLQERFKASQRRFKERQGFFSGGSLKSVLRSFQGVSWAFQRFPGHIRI